MAALVVGLSWWLLARAPAAWAARPAQSNVTLYHHHCPKTGGTSLTLDAAAALRGCAVLPPSATANCTDFRALRGAPCGMASCEGFLRTRLQAVRAAVGGAAPIRVVLLLRRPAAHVRSMWAHCLRPADMSAPWVGWRYADARISYGEWLGNWSAIAAGSTELGAVKVPVALWRRARELSRAGGGPGARAADGALRGMEAMRWQCEYDPRNPQSASLGAQLGRPMRAKDGAGALRAAFALGVTERYGALLCALQARLGARPDACACGGEAARRPTHHVTHGSHPERIAASEADAARVAALTRADEALYARALLRVDADARRACAYAAAHREGQAGAFL